MDWYNELQRRTVSPENAARLHEENGKVNVAGSLGSVASPTLVLHASGDALVPFDFGRESGDRHSRRTLRFARQSQSHPSRHEPAFQRFLEELRRFVPTEESDP